ncbi:hypothetical protein K435DRAFT_860420 [Dendrothele bispora CBS 962.96]|uniref:Uncharacterized protein n=1 Tax=Dendrothele bispora (strain CBS 962.96) TaxID=1314807 RepID=A0A4S8LYI7_DENBC|nr:hypothetical protein K435DRAFT_860420 [Dendrothele bispora CBS 962.96]
MGYRTVPCEDKLLKLAYELKFLATECDCHAVATPLGLLFPPSMFAPPPLLPESDKSAPCLEWVKRPRRCISNQGTGSKTGEEVEILGEREEGTGSVHNSSAQLPEQYEYGHHSTAPAVPLASKGLLGVYQHPHTRAQFLQGEGARETLPDRLVVNSPPPFGNHALRPTGPPSFLGTTSTQGSISWVRPRNLGMPVQHIVGGFGGEGDPKGSSYRSSESDHGGGNGGGGRPPGWGMMTQVIWITTTKDEVMTANREEVSMGKTGIMNHVVVHVGEDHWEVTLWMMENWEVADMETPKGVTERIQRREEV